MVEKSLISNQPNCHNTSNSVSVTAVVDEDYEGDGCNCQGADNAKHFQVKQLTDTIALQYYCSSMQNSFCK